MNRTFQLATILALLIGAPSHNARALTNDKHPSVMAAMACIKQIAPIVKKRRTAGPDVACDIPVSLAENDLDELFKAAMRSSSMSEKVRGTAEKYSSAFAKTLTNFRAADCTIKLRVKRSDIIAALTRDELVLRLADQPANCDITTKKYKVQKLKFAFSPRINMKQGCVEKFALNMGKIDAGCKVCYFNRLYLSTKLVGLWANNMSHNAKRALNIQLGKQCR